MRELFEALPDPEAVVAMEPEELGAKLLFVLRKHQQRERNHLHLQCICNDDIFRSVNGSVAYPREQADQIKTAFLEAWDWLEREGLIIPEPGQSQGSGWRRFSRRAQRIEDEPAFVQYELGRRVPRESLNKRIRDKVWMAFVRGEFDVAVFQAMKAVEVAVREAAGLPAGTLGVKLMREAFAPANGKLTNLESEPAES